MKPVSGEKTPVEIISRSERVLGPSVTLRRLSAFCFRSSRSSSGARRSTRAPPCGILVVYSISTFISSPPGSCPVWGGEPAHYASGKARYAVIPGTLADDPQPQLVRVAAGDLKEPGAVHTDPLQDLAPLRPERAGDEACVLDDAGALLGGVLEQGAHLRSQPGWLARQRQPRSCVVQSVPHRFVFDRGAVRPGVVVQVLLVVYKQRGVGVEGPLETIESHPLVQAV